MTTRRFKEIIRKWDRDTKIIAEFYVIECDNWGSGTRYTVQIAAGGTFTMGNRRTWLARHVFDKWRRRRRINKETRTCNDPHSIIPKQKEIGVLLAAKNRRDKDEQIENMAMIFTNAASTWKCSVFALRCARGARTVSCNGWHDRTFSRKTRSCPARLEMSRFKHYPASMRDSIHLFQGFCDYVHPDGCYTWCTEGQLQCTAKIGRSS